MYEKAIEELIRRFPDEALPVSQGLRLVDSQRRLPSGRMLDLCFEDNEGVYYVIELKRHRVSLDTISQLSGYLEELKQIEPSRKYIGVLAAFVISSQTQCVARNEGILCWAIDQKRLIQIAEREGLRPDAMVRAPRIKRDPRFPTPPRLRSGPLPTSDLGQVESAQALYKLFPPGTIDRLQPRERVLAYWREACPNAPVLHQEIATDLTIHCLQNVMGATIQRRTMGKVDPYTVIVNISGVSLAAIDARKNWVKLDFLLPLGIAQQCREERLLTIENARRAGHWVQSNVPRKLSMEKAKDLLDRSFEFQFGTQNG